MKPGRLIAVCLALTVSAAAGAAALPVILPLEERAAVVDRWLQHRVETVLPDLMRRTGIDMWLIIAREYNEDPVLRTLLPATWLSARRRTMLLIHDAGAARPLETLAVARYPVGAVFGQAWKPEEQPDQWARLAALVAEREPRRIGINVSEDFALADGLSHTERRLLLDALPQRFHQRLVSAQALAVGWLETRTHEEIAVYRQICRIAHGIIAEGLSEAAVQPGVTTTDDLAWWFRERVSGLGLATWFHPSVSIQRPRAGDRAGQDTAAQDGARGGAQDQAVPDTEAKLILPGDLLHVDFGIRYLRLHTDTQQHAYVLRPGETRAPAALRQALADGNRLQDILTGEFVAGRTGNEILAAARAQARQQGIEPSIYTHPLGYHGHAAGPTIGLWDRQQGVPGSGDYPLHADTVHSIELAAIVELDSWHRAIRIKLEEDAFFDGERVRYLDGRQTELHLIPRQHR